MNERKPVQAAAGEKAARPDAMQQKPPRSEATMHTDAPVRKAGGRLSREDQRRLGDILQRVYDEVVRQGVPDRFKDLLNELNGGPDSDQAGQKPAAQKAGPAGDQAGQKPAAQKAGPAGDEEREAD